jgi:hypothetical protein
MGDGVIWGMSPGTLVSVVVLALLIAALIRYVFLK